MPLIDCPNCKKKISDEALVCPHCGSRFPEKYDQYMKKWKKEGRKVPWMSIKVVIAVAVLGFLGWRTYSCGGFYAGVVDPILNYVKQVIPIDMGSDESETVQESPPPWMPKTAS